MVIVQGLLFIDHVGSKEKGCYMSIWDEYEPFTINDLRDIEKKAQYQADLLMNNQTVDMGVWRIYMDMANAASMLKTILDKRTL